MGLLCVTVDLDELDCYHAIHGLEPPDGEHAHIIYRRALPRLYQFFDMLGVEGTVFAVGKDVSDPESAQMLRNFVEEGHEVGNHSMSHRYDLTSLRKDDQSTEIGRAASLIEEATGVRPVGFRAPGYNVTLGLIEALEEQEYLYDSSVFPCPAYFSAKAAAIGLKAMRGRRSASLVGDPRVLRAPTAPYRIGSDGVWNTGEGLREMPITVLSPARIPFIGTSLALMGAIPASILAKLAARLPVVNLELHGIDFMDADGDGISYIKKYQPEMRISYVKRHKTFERVIKTLLDDGLEPVTLKSAAQRLFV